ncbi:MULTISPECIES: PIN domain nuclease [Sphingomonas]|uniref:type II toxin-antitoxin system VapC family toxin n=1 Tax=Sphingomonas TaxID=13687 RepID=UPI00193B8AE1|nr:MULTISPECIES: PIN domain nuclease [Sphingomonas]
MTAVVVDSSIWIDRLADRDTAEVRTLRNLILARHRVMVGDLMLAEVLQGTTDDRHFDRAHHLMASFDHLAVTSHTVAVEAARNYRRLRALGITVRKTIDTLIATRCILDDMPLLYRDRDFDPFVQYLGLRSAMAETTGVN